MNYSIVKTSLIIFILSACAAPTPVSTPTAQPPTQPVPRQFTDGLGRQVQITTSAKRIVSLAPSNTEMLFAIGAGSQVVGRDTYSDFPEEAKILRDVGDYYGTIEMETILSLQPDLVLVSALSSAEQVQSLEDLGVKVFVVPNPLDFEGLYANLLTVAELTGHKAEAQEIIQQIQQRVVVVEDKVTSKVNKPLVFYELDGTDPMAPWTAGPNTFVDTLIGLAGGNNLGSTLTGEWVQISIEALIAQDPEIILLGDADWGGVTPESVALRTGWEALSAVKAGKVYPFDDNLVSRPGPRLILGLETLAEFFHPELFE
jgi:iron complex transport system substrate-binding protein